MALAELDATLATARRAIADLDAVLVRLERVLVARTPVTPRTTIHAAWARHPGVREVFAGLGLPACDACSVGADETLEEAAFGYGVDLAWLLRQLNGLV